nr:MAG TPA: hypothetical protein [Caudoviricetes sp.]
MPNPTNPITFLYNMLYNLGAIRGLGFIGFRYPKRPLLGAF